MDIDWPLLGDFLGKALNSNFASSLLAAAAGAFAGAWASQRIADRSKRRSDLLQQLRGTNAAIMVSGTICNSFLGFKSQFAKPLFDTFQKDRTDFLTYQEKRKAGQSEVAAFQFNADFRDFSIPLPPVETLKELIHAKLSLTDRSISALANVEQAIQGLSHVMEKRRFFAEQAFSGSIWNELLPAHYFGLPLKAGHVSELHPDLVFAIHSYTNDIIAFSHYLCESLIAHGGRVRSSYIKAFDKKIPEITTINFSKPRANGLFPPDSDYASWLAGYRDVDSSKSSGSTWWKRLKGPLTKT